MAHLPACIDASCLSLHIASITPIASSSHFSSLHAISCGDLASELVLRPRSRPLPLRAPPGARASNSASNDGGGSYLNMWKRAKERHEQEQLQKAQQSLSPSPNPASNGAQEGHDKQDWEKKAREFEGILRVPSEERDKVQRMQVMDRAAAALAAANAFISEQSSFRNSAATLPPTYLQSVSEHKKKAEDPNKLPLEIYGGNQEVLSTSSSSQMTLGSQATLGPDFWSWSPPPIDLQADKPLIKDLQPLKKDLLASKPDPGLLEKEPSNDYLNIAFESTEPGNQHKEGELPLIFQSRAKPSLPPLQSLREIPKEIGVCEETSAAFSLSVPDIGAEVASFVQEDQKSDANVEHGVSADGSQWWKESGKELHENGVVCSWTIIRGVNRDGVEWEEKFWEAFDDLDYKELGAEKSGRDAVGNVWREFWKEAMWQDMTTGLLHLEKTADKWAKNGQGGEWHEKWWEHHDASGHTERWADKWSKIDPATPLEPGHAHVWHERWGENFDGQGEAMKYTDKWAERAEFGGWSKWGDKWDERFNKYGHGVKQGETWWEGVNMERWNRTWGEQHNGTGWVHKYGKSSSGEHWDTYEKQDTWYERQAHFGFHHCLENSQELQRVGRKKTFKF